MKSIVIYKSVHHGNTKKIAGVIAKEINAVLVEADKITAEEVNACSLVGFGSGIYYGKFHDSIVDLINSLSEYTKKKAFIFSTSGSDKGSYHDFLKTLLLDKGFDIVGEFNCRGYDTMICQSTGGINKGRPGISDIDDAISFAKKISG